MRWTCVRESMHLAYEYDMLGNITKVIKDGMVQAEYTYNDQSQLISEKLPQRNQEYCYSYDTRGNVRSKTTITSSGTNTITYGYEDTDWKDLLTAVKGDELASAQQLSSVVNFEYDAAGMRTSKECESGTYHYKYLGGLLVEETCEGKYFVLEFSYDSNGIGEINPLRYRGYYYDEETGFYYLNSRYYDPKIGRFINVDGLPLIGDAVYGEIAISLGIAIGRTETSSSKPKWLHRSKDYK